MADALTLYDSPGSPCAWLTRVVARPSFARSEDIRPD